MKDRHVYCVLNACRICGPQCRPRSLQHGPLVVEATAGTHLDIPLVRLVWHKRFSIEKVVRHRPATPGWVMNRHLRAFIYEYLRFGYVLAWSLSFWLAWLLACLFGELIPCILRCLG